MEIGWMLYKETRAMKSIARSFKDFIEALGKPKLQPVPVPVRVR